MTQTDLDRANYIKTVLDKINKVLNKTDDGKLWFTNDCRYDDIGWLAFYELEKEFLEILEKKKHALECEFANM